MRIQSRMTYDGIPLILVEKPINMMCELCFFNDYDRVLEVALGNRCFSTTSRYCARPPADYCRIDTLWIPESSLKKYEENCERIKNGNL